MSAAEVGGERVDLTDPIAAERDLQLRNLNTGTIAPLHLTLDKELLARVLEAAYEALHIAAEFTDGLRIECNWCSGGDYLWADGEPTPSSGCWEAAIEHLTTTHADRFRVQL